MSDTQAAQFAFLFTDIEGSTRLWESAPAAMSRALARHDELMRQSIAAHAGQVFKTAGDAFCAVFPDAADALAAALAAQRALASEPWDIDSAIRVRMAIHVEGAEERDGDYFGPALNRVARLLSTAHGEQIVVSRAARQQAGDTLPSGVSLRDLGEFTLKDLLTPERIFQAVAPGLRATFPPLRTPERLLRGVPRPATPLLGRQEAVAAVRRLLAMVPGNAEAEQRQTRLVTLTGPGGTGKTRLALHLAQELGSELEDGAVFVPLAAVTDPSLAPVAVASALEVGASGESPRQAVLDALRDRRLLLILDNTEQVMGIAPFVAELLSHAPRVLILVTSRERLNVRGEQELALPPLALPEATHEGIHSALSQDDIERSPAVQLFVDRTRSVKPDFAVTAENAATIAAICARLDGLPLAIELAAARARLLSPDALLDRFDRRLDLLSKGARDLPERQQTMRSTIAWSYDLLSEEEQQVFSNLGVFAGGASLPAAEAVALQSADETFDLDVLESLAEKSLIRILDGIEPRLFMFETIRDYARERLAASAEAKAVADRHAAFFLALAEEAEPELAGRRQTMWLRNLAHEQANLRAAIAWLRQQDEGEQALRMSGALWRFWWLRGDTAEDRALMEALLRDSCIADPLIRAKALNGAGVLAESQGDWEGAAKLHMESLAISRAQGDLRGVAWSLNNLGVVELNQGNFDQAQELLEENLAIAEQVDDPASIASALIDLGQIAHYQGDQPRAADLLTRALERFRALGDESHTARALNNLGTVAIEQGQLAEAQAFLSESLELHRLVGDRHGIASTLNNLAEVANERGDCAAAFGLYVESHALALESGNRLHAAIALENLAALVLRNGDARGAAPRYREALRLYQATADQQGIVCSLAGLAKVAHSGGDVVQATSLLSVVHKLEPGGESDDPATWASLSEELGAERFHTIWEVAQATPLESVIQRAVAGQPIVAGSEIGAGVPRT